MKVLGNIIRMLGYILVGTVTRKSGITEGAFWVVLGCATIIEMGTFIRYGLDERRWLK